MASNDTGINGDPVALLIDRAVGEVRRGRAIRIRDTARCVVVAAVETVQGSLLKRLEARAREGLLLLVTAERGESSGLVVPGERAVVLAVDSPFDAEALRAVAGIGTLTGAPGNGQRVVERPELDAIADAAFRLAKAGKLLPALVAFETDDTHDPSLLEIDVASLGRYAGHVGHSLKRTSASRVPLTDAEDCEIALFRDEHGLGEHVAVLIGRPDPGQAVPVRLHSACLTGDLLGSLRCDCGEQLKLAVARIAELGGGVLLYLDQEGRNIGLANKLRAYAIQDTGLDTVDADRHLGFHSDERNYDVAAALLHELGIARVTLLTNNPHKIAGLRQHGIDVVGRLPLVGSTNAHNERYLRAKRERAGHLAEESG